MDTQKQPAFKHRAVSEYTKEWGLFGRIDPTVFYFSYFINCLYHLGNC